MQPMAPKRTKLSDQLRHAIETADRSRYVLSRETGIDQATLSRFMTGRGGLSIDVLDKLTEALQLELTPKTARKKKGGG
jgi:transcriptional regulator with XRE-family HTH domain